MPRQRHLVVSSRIVNPPAPKRKATRIARELTNANLAELLALEAAKVGPPLNRAFRRASRRAFLWPDEAGEIIHRGGSLTELHGIGPYLERALRKWIAHSPAVEGPPPLRTGFLTLTRAQSILDSQSHWLPGVKGDLQMHTLWSDGSASIADMAWAAIERGYDYIAITDHGKALKIAGGIDEQQLRKQAREIETVNHSLAQAGEKLRVLHSIELNLSPAGEGDMEADALAQLDIVIGCFHSALRRKEDQTARYLAALNNPAIQILGHPRGRIYNYRIGLCADWPQVFDMAAELDKAVEIDAYPDRQDLSPDLLLLARKAGCRISFGTDSHGPSQLRFMAFAAASALQAGIKRERILNFMSREQLLDWVRGVREKSSKFERKR